MPRDRGRHREPLVPYDPRKAAVVLDDLRAGRDLVAALKRAGVSQRTLSSWLKQARRKAVDPELEPYRQFAAAFRRAAETFLND